MAKEEITDQQFLEAIAKFKEPPNLLKIEITFDSKGNHSKRYFAEAVKNSGEIKIIKAESLYEFLSEFAKFIENNPNE